MGLFAEDKTLLRYNGKNEEPKSFYETKGYLADSTFFRMFTYQFIEGNASTSLNEPRTVVLSEDIAKKLLATRRRSTNSYTSAAVQTATMIFW